MNVYERFKALNKRLVCGDRIYFGRGAGDGSDSRGHAHMDRLLHYPKIGIYTGTGASHSWLWFVEIFDRMGFYDLSFLAENHIKVRGLDSLDVLAMSGGDTFAIAKGLGQKGAEGMESFIRGGGL